MFYTNIQEDFEEDIDCQVSDWGKWKKRSKCTKTCGGGKKVLSRKRRITSHPSGDGEKCPSLVEYKIINCNKKSCKVCRGPNCNQDCVSKWNKWRRATQCDEKCGGGKKLRERVMKIIKPQKGTGKRCPSSLLQTQEIDCNTRACPINCEVSEWSEWSNVGSCSADCGGGKQQQERSRSITTNAANGGTICPTNLKETKEIDCNTQACPIDCEVSGWSEWSNVGSCSKTCGGGKQQQERTRSITKNASNGGTACPTNLRETKEIDCNTQACPINCEVSEWSEWSNFGSCSADCGGGKQQQERTRSITTNASNGGTACPTNLKETKEIDCNTQACPINCEVSEWSSWSNVGSCSKTCGGGKQSQERTRSITKNAANGGTACPTNLRETKEIDCNTQACPINCEVSEWSEWSNFGSCSKTCGGGKQQQERTRSITTNAANGGTACPTNLRETKEIDCNTQACIATVISTSEIGLKCNSLSTDASNHQDRRFGMFYNNTTSYGRNIHHAKDKKQIFYKENLSNSKFRIYYFNLSNDKLYLSYYSSGYKIIGGKLNEMNFNNIEFENNNLEFTKDSIKYRCLTGLDPSNEIVYYKSSDVSYYIENNNKRSILITDPITITKTTQIYLKIKNKTDDKPSNATYYNYTLIDVNNSTNSEAYKPKISDTPGIFYKEDLSDGTFRIYYYNKDETIKLYFRYSRQAYYTSASDFNNYPYDFNYRVMDFKNTDLELTHEKEGLQLCGLYYTNTLKNSPTMFICKKDYSSEYRRNIMIVEDLEQSSPGPEPAPADNLGLEKNEIIFYHGDTRVYIYKDYDRTSGTLFTNISSDKSSSKMYYEMSDSNDGTFYIYKKMNENKYYFTVSKSYDDYTTSQGFYHDKDYRIKYFIKNNELLSYNSKGDLEKFITLSPQDYTTYKLYQIYLNQNPSDNSPIKKVKFVMEGLEQSSPEDEPAPADESSLTKFSKFRGRIAFYDNNNNRLYNLDNAFTYDSTLSYLIPVYYRLKTRSGLYNIYIRRDGVDTYLSYVLWKGYPIISFTNIGVTKIDFEYDTTNNNLKTVINDKTYYLKAENKSTKRYTLQESSSSSYIDIKATDLVESFVNIKMIEGFENVYSINNYGNRNNLSYYKLN